MIYLKSTISFEKQLIQSPLTPVEKEVHMIGPAVPTLSSLS